MKIFKYIIFLFIVLVFILSNFTKLLANTSNFYEFVYWEIGDREYKDNFLLNLDIDKEWIGKKCCIENSNGIIKRYVREQPVKYDGDTVVEYGNYNFKNMHSLLCISNLNLLSKANINAIMEERGINDEIKRIDFIDPTYERLEFLFPYTIMITTAKNDKYFMVVQRQNYCPYVDCKQMEFFTKEEFIEKYCEKTGTLYVDGKLISNNVKFWDNSIAVPIRTLLESMNYKVDYYVKLEEGNIMRYIDFYNDDEKYTINITYSTIENYEDKVAAWGGFFYSKADNMFWAPDTTVKGIVSFLKKTIIVDKENRNIFIE